MVGTRAQRSLQFEMERTRLESATLEELRQEALRYQLAVSSTSTKELLVEAILANLQQNSPMEEMLPTTHRSRNNSDRSRKGSVPADLPGPSHGTAPTPDANSALDRISIILGVFIEQQRQMIDEIRTWARRDTPAREEIPQQRAREEITRSPAISTSSPAQAVTLLSPQIPEFGGTDDENVLI